MPSSATSRTALPQGWAKRVRPSRMTGRRNELCSKHRPSILIGGHAPPLLGTSPDTASASRSTTAAPCSKAGARRSTTKPPPTNSPKSPKPARPSLSTNGGTVAPLTFRFSVFQLFSIYPNDLRPRQLPHPPRVPTPRQPRLHRLILCPMSVIWNPVASPQ